LTNFGKWVRERREAQDERDEKLERKLEELLAKASEVIGVQSSAEALAEAEEAGTRKGRSFEDRVHEALERIATARGDAAVQVGDAPGAGGSKKGDVLVEIGAAEGSPSGRIGVEVKDARLSRPKAWEELNGALAARGASFAVLVVSGDESLPPEREQLHEYEGNKLIVAVDPENPDDNSLDVAYRFARLRVLLAREAELTVDAPGVRDAASEARAALDAMKAIKSALSKATNNVDQARGAAETMVATVLDRLERIETLVSAVEPEPD
jgi:predicted ribosome quality control (RQC) complex YloA/Tae2 family protein